MLSKSNRPSYPVRGGRQSIGKQSWHAGDKTLFTLRLWGERMGIWAALSITQFEHCLIKVKPHAVLCSVKTPTLPIHMNIIIARELIYLFL